MTNTHHRYSPSSIELFEACPCYKPDDSPRDTTAADEGTLMHLAAETDDVSILETEEQIETVERVLAFKRALIATYDNPTVLNEERVTVDGITRGTVDLTVIEGTLADIVDYKFGRNPVTDADTNGQVQSYVAGTFEKYPDLETIRATLLLPRQDHVTTATYTRSDLEHIRLRLATVVARCEADDKVPNPTDKGCTYCGNKASCSALHTFALSVARDLPVPVSFDLERMADPQEMAKLLVLGKLLEDWSKQMRSSITKLAVEDGVEIPGYGIASRGGSYEITEVLEAISLVIDKYEVDLSAVTQACKVSIPKLTDVVAAVEGRSKKEIREELLTVLEDCIVQGNAVTYLKKQRGITNEEIIQG